MLSPTTPRSARLLLRIPVVRIWTREWLRSRGYVARPQLPPGWGEGGDPAGDREPRRPRPMPPSLAVALDEPAWLR